jgi:hypothetical protein
MALGMSLFRDCEGIGRDPQNLRVTEPHCCGTARRTLLREYDKWAKDHLTMPPRGSGVVFFT